MHQFFLESDESFERICGEILITSKGRIASCCTVCGDYQIYEEFISHLEKCITERTTSVSTLTTEKDNQLTPKELRSDDCQPEIAVVEHDDTIKLDQSDSRKRGCEDVESDAFLKLEMSCDSPKINVLDEEDENTEYLFSKSQTKKPNEADYSDINQDNYLMVEYLESETEQDEHENITETNTVVFSSEESQECNQQDSLKDNTALKEPLKASSDIPLIVRNVRKRNKYFPSTTPASERKHKCPVCGFAFKDRHNMKLHLKRHTNDKRFSCPDCDKKFFTSTEVRIHSRMHTKPENQFLCTECGLSFESNYRLVTHQKRHRNQRDYICKVCNKGFFQYGELKNHMATHSSNRPYICEICNGAFKRPHILKAHMKQHENKREYKCNLCDAAFNVSAGLYSHMKSRHKDCITKS